MLWPEARVPVPHWTCSVVPVTDFGTHEFIIHTSWWEIGGFGTCLRSIGEAMGVLGGTRGSARITGKFGEAMFGSSVALLRQMI